MPASSGTGYLVSVSALGLPTLNAEPNRLRAEAQELESKISTLALQNYRVFIANHDCVRALRTQSKHFNESSTNLRDELQTFVQHAESFGRQADTIIGAHRRNRQTLQQHMQVSV